MGTKDRISGNDKAYIFATFHAAYNLSGYFLREIMPFIGSKNSLFYISFLKGECDSLFIADT